MPYNTILTAPYKLTATRVIGDYQATLTAPYSISATYAYIESSPQDLAPSGLASSIFGMASIKYPQTIAPNGVSTLYFGSHFAENAIKSIAANGFNSQSFGKTKVYNLIQYELLLGEDQSAYGNAYLQGGVKHLYVSAFIAVEFGATNTLNTTADQSVRVIGIVSPDFHDPNVSPRMLYAAGFYSQEMGGPDIRSPVILPKGIAHTKYGNQTIWFHTRPLLAGGIASFDTGYPLVKDLAQYIQVKALTGTGVFGDTYIKNTSSRISAYPINDEVVSDWTVIVNKKRVVALAGVLSQNIGSNSIRNKSPSIAPYGISSILLGKTGIGYKVRSLKPSGFDRLGLGLASLTKTPQLFPTSINQGIYGATVISNAIRYIKPLGDNNNKFGESIAWFGYRVLSARGWASEYTGKPTMSHGVRAVETIGSIMGFYGQAWLSDSTRLLQPKSIYRDYPSSHTVGRHQKILPLGYIATLFGSRIVPDSKSVYPLGFAGDFGLTEVGLYTRTVKAIGYISVGQHPVDRWGNAKAYNLRQYVQQNYDGDNGLVPPAWSAWTLIENRNKQLNVTGLASHRFGYSKIDNLAAPLLVRGIIPPIGNNSSVTHAIRQLILSGMSPPFMSSWAAVYNSARVLRPIGVDHSATGIADAVNTRRYYRSVGRIDALEAGTPMIAYRIRTLDIEKRYSIAPPLINLPTVELFKRYVGFSGFEATGYSAPSLSINFNKITTRWEHRDSVGSPTLRNVTPELLTKGRDISEFGLTAARTEWRDVYARGDNTALFGLLKISDTKQGIYCVGWRAGLSSQLHTVTKTVTNPYSLQYIYLNNEAYPDEDGFGIFFDEARNGRQVSSPSLNQNVLYQKGHDSSIFGSGLLWSNNIEVSGDIALINVSPNVTVRLKTRVLDLDGKGMEKAIVEFGKPRLSPLTVWAVMEAPLQARQNHDSSNLHLVNSRSMFGLPALESTIRTLKQYHNSTGRSQFGDAGVGLYRRVLQPESFRLSRMGVPSIPFTPQEIKLREGIYSAAAWGATKLERPPYVGPIIVNVRGSNHLSFGDTYADNFIRILTTKGSDSLIIGQSKQGDTPFMWQGLRIGEHVPLIIGGGDTSRHGLTWISLHVRELSAEGFDAFRSEYELSNFKEHMTVKNADKKLPVIMRIETTGINPSNSIGYQDVKLGQRYIRPDGNSGQFRKGGYHA